MSKQPLIQVSCLDQGKQIGLSNYADMVAYNRKNTVAALRIGGYPERVQAMSAAILGGCELELTGSRRTLRVHSREGFRYERKISQNGVYAEGIFYLRDDPPPSPSEKETAAKRNLYFFCHNEAELFTELDRRLSVPLIPSFQDYVISELKQRDLLEELTVYCLNQDFCGWQLQIAPDEQDIVQILEDGLKNGDISIPGASGTGAPVFGHVRTFTQYLQTFGGQIAERIKGCFPPRFDPSAEGVSPALEEVNRFVMDHAHYSLFSAQLGAAEALERQLETDKMALLVAECGTGKTKIGSAALYAYQKKSRRTKAFNVVVCPSHITGKWVREVQETIPDCIARHAVSITDIDRLYGLYQKEKKTVYCILSKETARNSYMRRPAVRWSRVKKGFLCPHCGKVQEAPVLSEGSRAVEPVSAGFYRQENNKNRKCRHCGQPLWTVLNPGDLLPGRNEWIRIGGYGFIHRRFIGEALLTCKADADRDKIQAVAREPQGIYPAAGAYRRYALSAYIRQKCKRIDALIVDELHQYSGESAQGQAMAELAGIAGKVIGMTATLVNGYAKGIFYLLFRLKAHLMLLDHQAYGDAQEFCKQYGVVEEIYETDAASYNASSKSYHRKVRERFLPGISPLVYSRFLLENTVFLSLTDMGRELPDYEEIPIPCAMAAAVGQEYGRLEKEFRRIMSKDRKVGTRIQSAFLNLLSAYPDQPYGHAPVYNPLDRLREQPLVLPRDTADSSALLPKDEVLMQLIRQKTEAGERVIVYTAWTRLDTRTKLLDLLNRQQIPAAVLDRTVPTTKREAWVDKRVQEGVKVLIVNPALVETGRASARTPIAA